MKKTIAVGFAAALMTLAPAFAQEKMDAGHDKMSDSRMSKKKKPKKDKMDKMSGDKMEKKQ